MQLGGVVDALHVITESREETIRRHFASQDQLLLIKQLTQIDTVYNMAINRYYMNQYHDVDPADKGYIDFYDTLQ